MTTAEIIGRYFAEGEARSRAARLRALADGRVVVVLEDGPGAPITIAHASDKLQGVARKIYLADNSVFESDDDTGIDRLLGLRGKFVDRLTGFETSWRWAGTAFVVCVVLVVVLYRWGLPLAASLAATLTPDIYARSIDYGTMQTLDQAIFNPSRLPEEQQGRYRAIFAELLGHAGVGADAMTLEFRGGGILEANAFALPGGTVVLTDELAALSTSEDEIAGVLAHEIGHVTEQHSLQQIYRALGFYVLVGAITGDNGQLLDELSAQAGILQTTAYTREFERDADRVSVELMLKADRDPLALVGLLDRVMADCGESCQDTGLLSTHPGLIERAANIKNLSGLPAN